MGLYVNSRARRFGKTMAGSMIAAYYSKGANSRPLFEQLKIAKDPSFEKYLNKFNVIKLDINATYGRSNKDEDIVPLFTAKMREDFIEQFPQIKFKKQVALPIVWKRFTLAPESNLSLSWMNTMSSSVKEQTCHIPNGEIRGEWKLAINDDANYSQIVKLPAKFIELSSFYLLGLDIELW